MEHILHIFGGGCGEHLAWPILGSVAAGVALAGGWVRHMYLRAKARLTVKR